MSKHALSSFAIIILAGTLATAAHAGGPSLTTVSGAPNPSTVGQNVTLTATFSSATSCSVAFVDQTNGNAPLCTASSVASTTGTCTANFATAGTRTVQGAAGGPCFGTQIYSQTVNAAPATVPTVGEWTMWGLAGLFVLGGAAMLARRTRSRAAI